MRAPIAVVLVTALLAGLWACGGKDKDNGQKPDTAVTLNANNDTGLTKRPPPPGVQVRFRTPDTLAQVIVQAFRNQDVAAYKKTFPVIADIYLAYYEAGYDDARIEQEIGDLNTAYPSIVDTYAQSFKAAIQQAQKAGVDFKSIKFVSATGSDVIINALTYKKPLTIRCQHASGEFVLEVEKSLHAPSGWFGSRLRFKKGIAS